ncbi:UNVERIFIED_ORG: signal transduction histidine kinase [Rhizobium etli]|uniref:hypothetical protein n=1 Tax=Rhizobium TaxID=379 RepID=UPI00019035A5|nr:MULTISPECIES: hypothetical protein [Rhizobium]ARQ58459.1 hypothetical protein Kim5_CH02409 [Rhizobium sp. Kim5]RSC15172.1 hypothetical protein EFR00_05000 [Rhizobium sophoriradicis]
MRDSFLREPQVELFFQAYLIGLLLGHLPFLSGDLGLGLLLAKFFYSLPIVFVLFVFYRIKFVSINSRPFLWGFIIFIATLVLVVVIFFSLRGGVDDFTRNDLALLEILLMVSAPSLLVTCIYFPVAISLRLRRSVG